MLSKNTGLKPVTFLYAGHLDNALNGPPAPPPFTTCVASLLHSSEEGWGLDIFVRESMREEGWDLDTCVREHVRISIP